MARQYETRLKIIDAMEQLLANRSLEKLHVSDICRVSGLSRTTFYVYFEDIPAAVQWCWDDLCSQTLYHINKDLTWDEGHSALCQGLLKRSVFYQKVFVHRDYRSLFTYGYHKALLHHIENLENKLDRPLTDNELIELDYAGRAHSAMTAKWAEEGMEVPVEKMVEIFHNSIPSFSL